MNGRLRDAAALLALCVVVAFWYRGVIQLSWLYDDAFHLRLLLEHDLTEYFAGPGFWAGLPFRMFTPVLFSSLELDHAIFGLNPAGYYVHQLIALVCAVGSLYLVARAYASQLWSFGYCYLILVGVPFSGLAALLMGRHYLEGMIFANLSALSFIFAIRRSRRSLQFLSAVLYLVAMLCKEIYAPLLVVLLIFPESNFRERVRRILPHACAALFYAGWRYSLIGTFLGGYGWALDLAEYPHAFAALPGKLVTRLFMLPDLAGWSFLSLTVALSIALAVLAPRILGMVAISGCLAMMSILPVSTILESRYAMLPWLAVVSASVLGAAHLKNRSRYAGYGAMLLLLTLGTFVGWRSWRTTMTEAHQMSLEAKTFLVLKLGDTLAHPLAPASLLGELKGLKEEAWQGPRGATWFYDDLFLCVNPSLRVWSYDPAIEQVKEASTVAYTRARSYCKHIREAAPLKASFRYASHSQTLYWKLGPYTEGDYHFVLAKGVQVFRMPLDEGFRLGSAPGIALQVRYDSPAGWVTYSPELIMDFAKQRKLTWSRR